MSHSRPHSHHAGFTLVELMVAIAVLAIILVVAARILSTTATFTTVNNKHMDANDQARAVFDCMADDFARMVRRKDIDYIFWKAGTNTGAANPANDAMYFYTEGASYFDSATSFSTTGPGYSYVELQKNSVSLVGYRVNNLSTSSDYNQLERLGKALSWDGEAGYNSALYPTYNSGQPNVEVFLTYPPAGNDVANGPSNKDPTFLSPAYSNAYFTSTLAGAYSNNASLSYGTLPSAVGTYPGGTPATSVFNDSTDTSYRSMGSQVFRFEYAFQLKDGTLSSIPVMQQSNTQTPTAVANGVPFSFLTATQRPLPKDDSKNSNADGTFAVGSRWYDTTNQIGYICLDATPKYAIWHEIGIQDIAAIIVTIAVIDKQGLVFVQNSGIDLATLAAQLPDYVSGTDPANMLNPSSANAATSWTYALIPTSAGGKSPLASATGVPQGMVSQIRFYQRCFYLNSF